MTYYRSYNMVKNMTYGIKGKKVNPVKDSPC